MKKAFLTFIVSIVYILSVTGCTRSVTTQTPLIETTADVIDDSTTVPSIETEPTTTTVAPSETVPETTATIAPSETVPETTAPTETASVTATPTDVVPETTASTETSSETTSPAEILPETTAPTETVTETITPTETVPTEPATCTPSKGNYLVKVNVAHNCITIYEKDSSGEYTVPIIAFVCSTGREGRDTPLGTFTTSDKYDWAVMGDGTYTQYVYRFNGPYLFHSVPYFTKSHSDLEYEEYNKLGEAASSGCVRLRAIDAKWIYDNVGVGSTVIIYSDDTSPGPLGKPEVDKIPIDSPYRGWDPTDPHPDNPWNQL